MRSSFLANLKIMERAGIRVDAEIGTCSTVPQVPAYDELVKVPEPVYEQPSSKFDGSHMADDSFGRVYDHVGSSHSDIYDCIQQTEQQLQSTIDNLASMRTFRDSRSPTTHGPSVLQSRIKRSTYSPSLDRTTTSSSLPTFSRTHPTRSVGSRHTTGGYDRISGTGNPLTGSYLSRYLSRTMPVPTPATPHADLAIARAQWSARRSSPSAAGPVSFHDTSSSILSTLSGDSGSTAYFTPPQSPRSASPYAHRPLSSSSTDHTKFYF